MTDMGVLYNKKGQKAEIFLQHRLIYLTKNVALCSLKEDFVIFALF
jgi:hypothetical protein